MNRRSKIACRGKSRPGEEEDRLRDKRYWIRKADRLLVGQARIGKKEWLAMFRRLVRDIDDHADDLANPAREVGDGLDPREPLVWAHCVLLAMPASLLQDYRALPETGGAGAIQDGLEDVRARRYAYSAYAALDTAHQPRLLWLARLVRVLDDDISQLNYLPTGDEGEDWDVSDWQVPSYPCYLVPLDRSHRLEAGKPASRRALRYHALVPTRVGECSVRLTLHPEAVPSGTGAVIRPWRCGAAIFEQLRLEIEADDKTFVVRSVECEDHSAKMTAHLEAARGNGCDIVMWPELTVPRALLRDLESRLARQALDPRKISVAAAGSWHVREKGRGAFTNRAPVYDGRGNLLFEYDKRLKFAFEERFERIEPGKVLNILVMGDRLVAIGICLDFCDDQDGVVYRALDVDLVLVPSMGKRSTTDAHARHARTLQTLHETTTFLVQQVPIRAGQAPPTDEPIGYSLLIPAASERPVMQNEQFRPLEGRKKDT